MNDFFIKKKSIQFKISLIKKIKKKKKKKNIQFKISLIKKNKKKKKN